MVLKKLKEFDNVRRGVIPGLGAALGEVSYDSAVEEYKKLQDCAVGETCEINNQATADWLIAFGWYEMEGVI